jgi:hypothetical protein
MKRSIAGCLVLGSVAALGASAGCGTSPPTTSTVQGTVDQASLPSPISSLTVAKSDGTSRTVAIDALGKFTIPLDSGASYRLFLGADGKSVPVAVRSTGGVLGERLTITSAGASVNIGTIRYWHGNTAALSSPGSAHSLGHPTTQVVHTASGVTPYILTGLPTVPTAPTAPSTNECANGVLPSGQPCATESAPVKCSDEDSDHQHTGCMHSGHDSADGPDGEHSVDGDHGSANHEDDDADAAAPFAVAGLNVSGDIGCGDDDHHHHDGEDDAADHHDGND